MKPRSADIAEAVARFGCKTANLGAIVPQVAGPAVGAFLGKRFLGPRLGKNMGDELGALIGGVTGGVSGRVVGDAMDQRQSAPGQSQMTMDPTMGDIPPWALAGAQALQPMLNKTSAHDEGMRDMLLGEIPGYAPIQGAREGGWQGAIKGTLGQVAGGVGGGALGMGAGALINKLVGHDVNIPGINMPLSHVLTGLGGTLGATKGFQAALGRR